MPDLAWRIFYDDGSTFDSGNGGPHNAPAFGVMCIVYPHELVGRKILTRHDWYYFAVEAGEWWGSDIFGLLDRLLHRLPTVGVCAGRNAPDIIYQYALAQADKDTDFSLKSGELK